MKKKNEKKNEKKEIYLVQESAFWSTIQDEVQNAVVQVVAQVGGFDWCEPYKIEEQYENYGSGFLINDQGYVVTNMHVISNAQYIWIYISVLGRKKFDAQVVSICPDRDIALLKITAHGLAAIKAALGIIPIALLGNSDDVRRSDNVLALGYPLGKYHLKSSTGIVSGREFMFGVTLLQITAPINPGNSGGPIFNLMGHVIGIAMAIESAAQNIGYVIPINELIVVITDMLDHAIVRKVVFGVRFADAADEKATLLCNPSPAGWYIVTVFKGTLLDSAGVMSGDMLYVLNGYQIDAYGEAVVPWSIDKVSVFDIISRVRYGDTVTIVIYRNGERKDISFIDHATDAFAVRERFPGYEPIDYEMMGGMIIMELARNHIAELLDYAPELVRYYHPEYCIDPVLVVTTMLPGSYVHTLRTIKPGDIIVNVNGVKVATLVDFRKAVRKSLSNGLLSIIVETEILIVLSLSTVLEDEKRLSEVFFYPVSSLVKRLQRSFKARKQNGGKKTTERRKVSNVKRKKTTR